MAESEHNNKTTHANRNMVKLGMVKNSMRNFLRNIALVFVPMGVFYLFLVVAMLLFASSTLQNVSGTISGFVKLVGESADNSSASVKQFFEYAFARIDWNGNFLSIVRQIIDTSWITETFKGFFATLSASSEGFDAQVAALVNNFTSTLKADIGVLASLTALGVVCANLLIRFLLRRRTARRNLKSFIISHTLVPLFESAMLVVAILLMWLLKWYALLLYVALTALWAVASLFNSWLIFRDGKVKPKQILTVENILSHIIVCVIMLVIVAAVFVALWFVNPIVSILVTIPVFIYAVNIIDVNTDSYVSRYIAQASGHEEQAVIAAEVAVLTDEEAPTDAAKTEENKEN